MAEPEREGGRAARSVALVTGASSGIGRALAGRLAREGRSVGLVARREERLEAVAREVRDAGGVPAVLPCDVTRREDVHAAVARCRDELGPVELFVANAGVSGRTDPRSLDAGDVERTLRVNFLGAVYGVEAVLPAMLERERGRLVAVSSLAGFGGLPLTAAYSASKAAMTNFFESLRVDLEGSGVGVTVIAPGYVRTPMTEGNRHAMPFMVEVEEAADRIHRAIGEGRRSLAFPWPVATFAWIARIFPRGVYDRIAGLVDRRTE